MICRVWKPALPIFIVAFLLAQRLDCHKIDCRKKKKKKKKTENNLIGLLSECDQTEIAIEIDCSNNTWIVNPLRLDTKIISFNPSRGHYKYVEKLRLLFCLFENKAKTIRKFNHIIEMKRNGNFKIDQIHAGILILSRNHNQISTKNSFSFNKIWNIWNMEQYFFLIENFVKKPKTSKHIKFSVNFLECFNRNVWTIGLARSRLNIQCIFTSKRIDGSYKSFTLK